MAFNVRVARSPELCWCTQVRTEWHRRSYLTFLCLERNNSQSKATLAIPPPPGPLLSKDFEYLIRRELDTEHAPGTLQRNGRASIVLFRAIEFFSRFRFECFSESQSSVGTIETETQEVSENERSEPLLETLVSLSLFGLNRSIPKASSALLLNKPSVNLPPFELGSSSATGAGLNSISSPARSTRDPADLLRFHPSSFALAMGTPPINPYQKLNLSSSLYNQFNVHQEHANSGNPRSFSCNYTPYSSSSMKLTLPSPILPVSAPSMAGHVTANSSRKTKVKLLRGIEVKHRLIFLALQQWEEKQGSVHFVTFFNEWSTRLLRAEKKGSLWSENYSFIWLKIRRSLKLCPRGRGRKALRDDRQQSHFSFIPGVALSNRFLRCSTTTLLLESTGDVLVGTECPAEETLASCLSERTRSSVGTVILSSLHSFQGRVTYLHKTRKSQLKRKDRSKKMQDRFHFPLSLSLYFCSYTCVCLFICVYMFIRLFTSSNRRERPTKANTRSLSWMRLSWQLAVRLSSNSCPWLDRTTVGDSQVVASIIRCYLCNYPREGSTAIQWHSRRLARNNNLSRSQGDLERCSALLCSDDVAVDHRLEERMNQPNRRQLTHLPLSLHWRGKRHLWEESNQRKGNQFSSLRKKRFFYVMVSCDSPRKGRSDDVPSLRSNQIDIQHLAA